VLARIKKEGADAFVVQGSLASKTVAELALRHRCRADQVGEHHCDLPALGSICGWASGRDDRCETDRLCIRSERTNGFQELETSTKRKTHLAEMILREIVQDVGVDRVLAEYRLILFEAKAPQPTSNVHDGALTSARRTLSKHADAPQALLRARRKRPRSRATEQRDERAAPHWTISLGFRAAHYHTVAQELRNPSSATKERTLTG